MSTEHLDEKLNLSYLEPKLAQEIAFTASELFVNARRFGHLHMWRRDSLNNDPQNIRNIGTFYNRNDEYDMYMSTMVRAAIADTPEHPNVISAMNIDSNFGVRDGRRYQFHISDDAVDIELCDWMGQYGERTQVTDSDERLELLDRLNGELAALTTLAAIGGNNFSQPHPVNDPL